MAAGTTLVPRAPMEVKWYPFSFSFFHGLDITTLRTAKEPNTFCVRSRVDSFVGIYCVWLTDRDAS